MSVDELRNAAETLRVRAENTTWAPACGGWWNPETNVVAEADVSVARTQWGGTAEYVAMMHPGVGHALADHLDAFAKFLDSFDGLLDDADRVVPSDALALARLINGSAK